MMLSLNILFGKLIKSYMFTLADLRRICLRLLIFVALSKSFLMGKSTIFSDLLARSNVLSGLSWY